MKKLYPAFLRNIQKFNLISDNDTVLCALSGGKDSVTLTLLLKELQKDIPFVLKAAYFNHRIREDVLAEESWVQTFCHEQQIDLTTGSRDVIRFREEGKLNLEHAASLSRYHFLNRLVRKEKNGKIATGHTKSDLTETFLIKLFRGSGLQGLSAIYGRKGEHIIRPLLPFSQQNILDFIERNSLQYYRDPTNRDEDFLRNRIRHSLLPKIREIEPRIDQKIFNTVTIIQDEYEYLSETAKKILKKSLILNQILPVSILGKYHISLRRQIIREYIRMLKGNLLNIDFRHIEEILHLPGHRKGLAIPGLELQFRRGFIYPGQLSVKTYSHTVTGPGDTGIPEINGTLSLKEIPQFFLPASNREMVCPMSIITFPLTIRSPLREDKYMKIHSNIHQKVFEMIRAAGIPAKMRNLCPTVINGNGDLIWSCGSPAADKYRVKHNRKGPFLHMALKGIHQT